MLPGMDGTGRLFEPFLDSLPSDVEANVVDYPRDRLLDRDELVSLVEARATPGIRHVVLAESFSGAIAVEYAERRRDDVLALVLCASFVSNPLPAGLRWLVHLATRAALALPIPTVVARMLLVGEEAPAALVREVKAAVQSVRGEVLAARIRSLATLDATVDLARLEIPVMYLQGTRDRLVGSRGARQVIRAAKSADIRLIDGPHLLLQARPRESAEAVLDFLNARGAR